MPPRRPRKNNSQKSNYYSNKKANKLVEYNKYNKPFFDDTILVSLPVKVDETGIGFSVFMEMTPIPSKVNRKERNNYIKWRLKKVRGIFNTTYDINDPDKKICSLYSALDRNDIRPTKVLSSRLVALNGSKKYETFINAIHKYSAETEKETQWHFTQSIPPSGNIMWFFGTASGFNKDAEIGNVTFECVLEYKELTSGANLPPDNEIDNEYEYFGNGEVIFKDYERDLTPDIELLSNGKVVGEQSNTVILDI